MSINFIPSLGVFMLHPYVVHFAIVLPIISLVLGLAYIVKPSDLMSKVSTRFMVFATIFLVIAFFTGKEDGSEVYSLLSAQGKETLLEHKDIGLYLTVLMGLATVLKFIGCFKKMMKVEVFAIALVVLATIGILYQGKIGGELTYTYGAHVEKHSDGMDCLEDPTEFLPDDAQTVIGNQYKSIIDNISKKLQDF